MRCEIESRQGIYLLFVKEAYNNLASGNQSFIHTIKQHCQLLKSTNAAVVWFKEKWVVTILGK
jgi:hypothetical protein